MHLLYHCFIIISYCYDEYSSTDPPYVSVPDVKVYVKEQQSTILICNATANPVVTTYRWFGPTGVEIRTNDSVVFVYGNRLSIVSLDRTHAGNYVCRPRNAISSGSTPATTTFEVIAVCK